ISNQYFLHSLILKRLKLVNEFDKLKLLFLYISSSIKLLIMRNLTTFLLVFLSISKLYSQSCDTNSLAIHKVSASVLDPSITPFEAVRHHSFYNSDCTPKNTLVFYIMGTYATTNMS